VKKKGAPAGKKAASPFDAVFSRLREILRPYARRLVVTHDTPSLYYLDTTHEHRGKPVFFAAARRGKAYVSFHIFAVYVFPDLLRELSPAVRKRMQGKSCFNFTSVDEAAFEELAQLTRRAAEAFKAHPLANKK
jgi:hypothetical protein